MSGNQLSFARRAQGVLSRIVPDRRRHKRVSVTMLGRFMRENKQEYPCRLLDISVGGAAVMSPVTVDLGERVVAYFDHIGGVEGVVVREFEGGFAFKIHATQHKREKLAAQLTWLANRSELGDIDDREHERLTPTNGLSSLQLAEGIALNCRVLDVSISGASIATPARPGIGTKSSSASCARAWCATTPKASACASSISRTLQPCVATSAVAIRPPPRPSGPIQMNGNFDPPWWLANGVRTGRNSRQYRAKIAKKCASVTQQCSDNVGYRGAWLSEAT
jgi:hypothetical protein